MNLELVRRWFSDECTIGELYVDGEWECFTLEDAVREGPKIAGATAIPEGTYQVVVSYSNRFERMMPLIRNVPGYEGIRIHSGNTHADTQGCILVGRERGPNRILRSRLAYNELFEQLIAATEGISITIRHQAEAL
jgi:hypothetical protein